MNFVDSILIPEYKKKKKKLNQIPLKRAFFLEALYQKNYMAIFFKFILKKRKEKKKNQKNQKCATKSENSTGNQP